MSGAKAVASGTTGPRNATAVEVTIIKPPRMTVRRWMVLLIVVAIVLWLVTTADRVRTDHSSRWLYHLWERKGSLEPGSKYHSQHQAPFWARYWRRLLD